MLRREGKTGREAKKAREKITRVDREDSSIKTKSTNSLSSLSEVIGRTMEKQSSKRNTDIGLEHLSVGKVRAKRQPSTKSGIQLELMMKIDGKKVSTNLNTGASFLPQA